MSLSDFEIGKIAEIVAGRTGARLDAKALRQVVDQVVDAMKNQQGNPDIKGVTCEVPRSSSAGAASQPTSAPLSSNQPLPPDQQMMQDRGGLYEQIERTKGIRIIIAAFGQNRPGVVAAITDILAEVSCNIEDISQTIMQEFFSMIMIVDIANCTLEFQALVDRLKGTEQRLGMKVYVMHEDIFRYMHRI